MKRKMRKDVITKRVIQAIAVCFGFIGLVWIYLSIHVAVTGVRDRDMFKLCMTLMLLIFGGIVVAVAYQNHRRFGPNSIKNVTFLVVFTLYCILKTLVRPYQEAILELEIVLLDLATFLIPLFLAYLLYSVVSRKLIQITETKNIQQDAEPDAENDAG